ncbi:Uncharacterised protein [Raoultella planticola]|uniref:Uncharacterized protein n=1 Tax=Raoultella planticola TaxID=575 RepID=A0A485A651_RAOPL|nr:Uncharacterised protein [Raoultella planticola]
MKAKRPGAFQVSFDSIGTRQSALLDFAKRHGIDTAETFITKMKTDHSLAVNIVPDYLRISTAWCGTIKDPGKGYLPMCDAMP